jgi:hypothetical protein
MIGDPVGKAKSVVLTKKVSADANRQKNAGRGVRGVIAKELLLCRMPRAIRK